MALTKFCVNINNKTRFGDHMKSKEDKENILKAPPKNTVRKNKCLFYIWCNGRIIVDEMNKKLKSNMNDIDIFEYMTFQLTGQPADFLSEVLKRDAYLYLQSSCWIM